MSKNYDETKEYSKIVMPEIIDILEDNNISFTSNSNNTEIIIDINENNDVTEESIEKLITDSTSVPKTIFVILVRLSVIDEKLYIRQSTI